MLYIWHIFKNNIVSSLESAGAIGGIVGVVVMIALMTAYDWNVLISAMIGLSIGFVFAFIGVIIINERNDRKKDKS